MEETKIKILIADDHTVVRKGLKALLSSERYGIEVIGEARNGEEAVQMALELKPDVILMDLVMPVKSGIDAIAEIRQAQGEARILVLTSFADDENVKKAIKAGASGFLLKDTSPDELVQTIQSVYRNKFILPQELTQYLLGESKEEIDREGAWEALTPRELDVLKCVARGLANKQVALELSISTTTVRTHVSSLIRKLNVENRTQLAIYARDHDLINME